VARSQQEYLRSCSLGAWALPRGPTQDQLSATPIARTPTTHNWAHGAATARGPPRSASTLNSDTGSWGAHVFMSPVCWQTVQLLGVPAKSSSSALQLGDRMCSRVAGSRAAIPATSVSPVRDGRRSCPAQEHCSADGRFRVSCACPWAIGHSGFICNSGMLQARRNTGKNFLVWMVQACSSLHARCTERQWPFATGEAGGCCG
jgi:hypothetical protein